MRIAPRYQYNAERSEGHGFFMGATMSLHMHVPNNKPSPRKDRLIRDAYKDYRRSLVYDEGFMGSTRQGVCPVRDPYTGW